MAKYHVNPKTGDPGKCRARVRCPFGDIETEHYGSEFEARLAYERANSPFNVEVEKREDTYPWPGAQDGLEKEFAALKTPGAKVFMQVGRCFYRDSLDRCLEAWLTTEDGQNVGFVKLIYHGEGHYPEVGPYLAMCDIEVRPDMRGKGLARELRESVEAEIGLLIYSSGSYTPEGWAAFGKHGRFLPNPYASRSDWPGPKYRSMGFVASWKDKLSQNPDRNIDYTDEQRDAMWDFFDSEDHRKLKDGEVLWAEE